MTTPYRPPWFRDGEVIVSNAPSCGVNKDGIEQYVVDADTGARSTTEIDDRLRDDAEALAAGRLDGGHLSRHEASKVAAARIWVPRYYDRSTVSALRSRVSEIPSCWPASLGELADKSWLSITPGHGSPSSDQRLGDVPYVKVSDLRAGRVNVNPTNRVPRAVAEKHWGGRESGLRAYDLVSPARASKNIGEFCALLPGQEDIVLTREVLVVRAGDGGPLDPFFLIWALGLDVVRAQWSRIVFMQTNREDVGERAREIEIPVSEDPRLLEKLGAPFRRYFEGVARLEAELAKELLRSPHHDPPGR